MKAKRFFENQEWASANAMYLLMMEEKPQVVSTYAGAVVADIMIGDTIQALDMIPRSMTYQIPLDSLLSDIKTISFSIGRGDLYEHYLLKMKTTYTWLSRVADNYLMQYYAFRQNGPELVKYARTMLAGLPDNLNFLRMLAYGLLLSGDSEGAEKTWLKTNDLYPDNLDTVLDLANFYDSLGRKREALEWMLRANDMHSSPYIRSRIATLEEIN